jgi:riboflavin kinase/FMN adenylyltransferase
MGYDNAFGKRRIGTPDYFLTRTADKNFDLIVVGPITYNGTIVSSSEIRNRLSKGDVKTVQDLMGRSYRISGRVIEGDGRGHRLGFATANIEVSSNRYVPMNGVYATRVMLNGRVMDSITNVGVRPTFYAGREDQGRSIEIHIFDDCRNLYGLTLELEFVAFLREEKRFKSSDELIEQVTRDIQKARECLDVGAALEY